MGSLTIRSNGLCSEVNMNMEQRRRLHDLYAHEVVEWNDEGQQSASTVSSSNCRVKISSRGKNLRENRACVNNLEVKKLNDRLTSLEEEAKMIKQEFIEGTEERKKLMSEIYRQFRVIRCCLRSGYQVTGDKSCKEGRMRSDGISEVLREDSHLSIVIKDLRANSAYCNPGSC